MSRRRKGTAKNRAQGLYIPRENGIMMQEGAFAKTLPPPRGAPLERRRACPIRFYLFITGQSLVTKVAGYFFFCLTISITKRATSTISKLKVKATVMASKYVMGVTPFRSVFSNLPSDGQAFGHETTRAAFA